MKSLLSQFPIRIVLVVLVVMLAMESQAQRVLNQEERQALAGDTDFLEKAQWAIRDYASYWLTRPDSEALTGANLVKWRVEYVVVKDVAAANYTDPNLGLRFVILSKGMQFAVDADPTTEEIIDLFVAGNKFEELASLYFEMLTQ